MKFNTLFTAALALLLCCFVASTSVYAEGLKIGTMSIQDIIAGSQAGQDARKVLEARQSELQPKLQADQDSLKEQAKEIEKRSSVWSEDVRASKERDYQKNMKEYQLKVEDAQYEMKQLEKNALDPIFKELQAVIGEIAKEKGLSMVFERAKSSGLLYADDSLDISGEIVKALDAKMAKE
jgi:outer membrane protein